MTDDETLWPDPADEPDEEPTEPWARPGAPTWEELLEEVKLRVADEETGPDD